MSRKAKAQRAAAKSEEVEHKVTDHRRPLLTLSRETEIREAATLYARAMSSDPFSYNRSYSHMVQGLEDVGGVKAMALTILDARDKRKSYIAKAA